MNGTQAIDAGPGTLTLGDTTYLVGQPSMMDIAALVAFLKKRLKNPVQELEEDPALKYLEESERLAMLREKAREYRANKDTWQTAAAVEALLTVDGVRFATWICCRKEQPSLTLEQVNELVTDENYHAVFVQLNVETMMDSLGNLAGRSG